MGDEAAVRDFMLVTGCADAEVARRHIAVTATLEDAVNLFFEAGEQSAPAETLGRDEEAYFVAQHKLAELQREYEEKFGFSITRRLSGFIFSQTTPLAAFAAVYALPLPTVPGELNDLLKYFPFAVKKPILAVCVAPPRPTPSQRELVERGALTRTETRAALQKVDLTAILSDNAQVVALTALGARFGAAPSLVLLGLDRLSAVTLVDCLELAAPDFASALAAAVARHDARLADDRRFVERLLSGQSAPSPPSQLVEERRLRAEQERNYREMVERTEREARAQREQQLASERAAAESARREAERAALARAFAEESVAAEHAIQLLFRLPNGCKVERAFDCRNTFQRAHDFVATLSEKGFSDPFAAFELRAGFPRVTLRLNERIRDRFPGSSGEAIEVSEVGARPNAN